MQGHAFGMYNTLTDNQYIALRCTHIVGRTISKRFSNY